MGQGVEKYVSAAMKRRILRGDIPQWMRDHVRADYLIKSYLAAPFWVHRRDFDALRKECDELTEATGIQHRLDHKIPITHPNVCGLTVPWNLQAVPAAVNAAKSNKWMPDQIEMYFAPREPEQLALWDEETRQRETGMNSKQRRRAEVKRLRSEGYWAAIHRKPRGSNPYTESHDMAQWDIGYQSGVDEIAQDEGRHIGGRVPAIDPGVAAAIGAGCAIPAETVAADMANVSFRPTELRACGPNLVALRDAFERFRPGIEAATDADCLSTIRGDAPPARQEASGSTIADPNAYRHGDSGFEACRRATAAERWQRYELPEGGSMLTDGRPIVDE